MSAQTSHDLSATGTGQAPVVIFLHVPKTGGMSMRQLVRRNYPLDARYEVRMVDGNYAASVQEIADLPDAGKRSVQIIFGHTVYGVHRFLPRPASYVTMLRKPTSLAVSAYHFIRRREANWLHDQVRELSVEEFILGPVARKGDNIQTRILAGEFSWDEPCTEETLERAKRNVAEHFVAVGLTERFDESVLLWADRFGWSKVYYERKNVTPTQAKSPVSPELLSFIEEHNRFDSELYRFVAERFERDLAEHPGVGRRLARYQRLNPMFGYLWRMRPGIRRRRKARARAAARF